MATFVEQLARQLEREFGPSPARRDQLIEWVDDQLNRCARLGVPGEAALAMIKSGYVEWRAQRKRLANSPCVFVSQAARVAVSHAERGTALCQKPLQRMCHICANFIYLY